MEKSFLKKISKKPKKLFKRLFWNFLFGYFPIAIIQAIGGIYGIGIITFNKEHLTGFTGFFASLFVAPLVVLLFTCSVWGFYVWKLYDFNTR